MNRRYRKTIIAGNWKMNKTASETKKFAEELKAILPKAKSVSYTHLDVYKRQEESRPRAARRKHRRTPAGNQRSADLRTLGRRLRMREEADEGNLVRSFRALDTERNYYQNAGSDRRQRRGGAEDVYKRQYERPAHDHNYGDRQRRK